MLTFVVKPKHQPVCEKYRQVLIGRGRTNLKPIQNHCGSIDYQHA